MQVTYYEHPTKWWMIAREGTRTATAYGARNSYGSRSGPKDHYSEYRAKEWADKTVRSKIARGYKPQYSQSVYRKRAERDLREMLTYDPRVNEVPTWRAKDSNNITDQKFPISTITPWVPADGKVLPKSAYPGLTDALKDAYGLKDLEDEPEKKKKRKSAPAPEPAEQPTEAPPGKLVLKHLPRDA